MSYSESQYIIDEVLKKLQESTDSLSSGELPPGNAIIEVNEDAGSMTFTQPDFILENQVLSTAEGVHLVMKKGSIPSSLTDGILLGHFTAKGGTLNKHVSLPLTLSALEEDVTYYIRAFSYSDHGVWNKSPANYYEFTKRGLEVYGMTQTWGGVTYRDYEEAPSFSMFGGVRAGGLVRDDYSWMPNMLNGITYTSTNSNYAHVNANSNLGTPTLGDWGNAWFLRNAKPYMVKYDGTADYELDPNDYTKKKDGTPSDVSNTNYNGMGAFVWIPTIYIKEDITPTGRTVQFASEAVDSSYIPKGFYDQNNNVLDGVWFPMFYNNGEGRSFANTPFLKEDIQNKTFDYIMGKMKTSMAATKTKAAGGNLAYVGGPLIQTLRDLFMLIFKAPGYAKRSGIGYANYQEPPDLSSEHQPILPNGAFYGTEHPDVFDKVNYENYTPQANKLLHSLLLGSNAKELEFIDPYYIVDVTQNKTNAPFGYATASGTGVSRYGYVYQVVNYDVEDVPYETRYMNEIIQAFYNLENRGSAVRMKVSGNQYGSMVDGYSVLYTGRFIAGVALRGPDGAPLINSKAGSMPFSIGADWFSAYYTNYFFGQTDKFPGFAYTHVYIDENRSSEVQVSGFTLLGSLIGGTGDGYSPLSSRSFITDARYNLRQYADVHPLMLPPVGYKPV